MQPGRVVSYTRIMALLCFVRVSYQYKLRLRRTISWTCIVRRPALAAAGLSYPAFSFSNDLLPFPSSCRSAPLLRQFARLRGGGASRMKSRRILCVGMILYLFILLSPLLGWVRLRRVLYILVTSNTSISCSRRRRITPHLMGDCDIPPTATAARISDVLAAVSLSSTP